MLKKKIFIIVTIAIILLTITNVCNAVTVTKESLSSAIEKIKSETILCPETSITNDTIDMVVENGNNKNTYKFNYNLNEKPTFSTEFSCDVGDYTPLIEANRCQILLYTAVTIVQGAELNVAHDYILNDLNNRLRSELNRINALTETEKITVSDADSNNSYEATIEKRNVTTSSYTLVYTLTVNTDADFSKLASEANTSTNTTTATNTSTTTNTNATSSVTKDTSDIKSIPKTGIEINKTVIVLYSIIGMAVVGIIILAATSKKK